MGTMEAMQIAVDRVARELATDRRNVDIALTVHGAGGISWAVTVHGGRVGVHRKLGGAVDIVLGRELQDALDYRD